MRTHSDCIPCLKRQVLEATRFVTDDIELQKRVQSRVGSKLDEMKLVYSPPEMALNAHRIVREECMVDDPYKQLKKRYNDIALGLYSEMKRFVEKSKNPLLTAVRLAIAGNIIDFGIGLKFNLYETMLRVFRTEFRINDFQKLLSSLGRSTTIAYLADNAGEIVFDKILIETILDNYEIDKILFVVKGSPIINDATIEDEKYVGIDKLSRTEVIKIENGKMDFGLRHIHNQFFDLLDAADIVISKGQGNYEAFSEQGGGFFLLMAKCDVLARDLGVKVGDIILKDTNI